MYVNAMFTYDALTIANSALLDIHSFMYVIPLLILSDSEWLTIIKIFQTLQRKGEEQRCHQSF